MKTQIEIETGPCDTDSVANQPRYSSKDDSDSQHGEDAADAYDDSEEGSEFSKQWKAVKFSRDEVVELLKIDQVSFQDSDYLVILNS